MTKNSWLITSQVDGEAMGSPLGHPVANVVLCSTEGILEREFKLPEFYKRYAEDTLCPMPEIPAATTFLVTLNVIEIIRLSINELMNTKAPLMEQI